MTANVLLAEAKHDSAPDEEGTENVNYTSSHWSTNAPKLVFHLGTQNNLTQISSHADLSFGFGNASEMGSMSYFNENGQGTSDTQFRITNTHVASHVSQSATGVTESATIQSLSAARVTLNWDNVTESGLTFGQLALGGDAIENISIDIIESPLADGEVSYTGPGFKPDALIALYGSSGSNIPFSNIGSYCGMGMSDGTTDVSSYQTSLNNQSTTGTRSLMKDQFISIYAHHGAAQETATVVSLDSTGYTLSWDHSLGSTEREILILAIKGPAVKVLRGTQPTSNSTVNRDAGFPPKAAIGFMSMKTVSTDSTDDSRLGVGFWSAEGDSQKSGGALDEDAQSTSDTDSYFSTAHGLKNYNHAQTVTGQATIGSSGDNLTEAWTNTDGTEYAHAWMIFGDTPSDFAEISVTGLSDNVITDGDTTPTTTDGTDFGSVTQDGSTVTRTFKVANSGALALTTETPTIPTGFTLTEGLATSIATSGNDTFSVRLDSSVLGGKHGTISFVNNDTTLNPFNFTVSGVVTAASDTPAASTGITSIISSGLSQLNTGNSLVSVGGARGLGASGTLITEITNTNRLDRTINEPGAPIEVLDSRFADRMDETSYYAGSGAYWGSAR